MLSMHSCQRSCLTSSFCCWCLEPMLVFSECCVCIPASLVSLSVTVSFLRAALPCHSFLPVTGGFRRHRSCPVWFLLHNSSLKLLTLLAWIFSIYVGFFKVILGKANVVSSRLSHHCNGDCKVCKTDIL